MGWCTQLIPTPSTLLDLRQKKSRKGSGSVVQKLGEGVPARVSSSSFDRGSKLRGSSQNSPHVASKRDVNITKLSRVVKWLPQRLSVLPIASSSLSVDLS
ncbi:hypothetical protein AVEN_99275-1 [Araneus ventricosus]|uniref:Uncharacterized protein n=1 Tax=Araneus ventricosus TaxID=182803 RepID=A0A4Y2KCW7_ARAVE|nr:hypothetical protein AVEN_99275-1 [Araneus ventricosus]